MTLCPEKEDPTTIAVYGSKVYLFDCRLLHTVCKNDVNETRILEVPKISHIGLNNIDVVLLSDFYSFSALPYITQCSNFRAKIYATVPTVELGRIFLMNLSRSLSRNNTGKSIYPVLFNGRRVEIYNEHVIERCLSKVNAIRYSEIIKIDESVEIDARSSGYCLGGANWILRSSEQKIVYMSATSDMPFGHSSTFRFEPLINADLLIVSRLPEPEVSPLETLINNIVSVVASALFRESNVLIPTNPVGLVYDLIPLLCDSLRSVGLSHIPVHFVSGVAKRSLHFSNILGEWMSAEHQERLYNAEFPLKHNQLLDDKVFYYHESAHKVFEFPGPYLVITGTPDVSFGESKIFYDVWKHDKNNVVIFTASRWIQGKLDTSCEMEKYEYFIETRFSLQKIIKCVEPKAIALVSPREGNQEIEFNNITHLEPFVPFRFDLVPKFINSYITRRSLRTVRINRSSTPKTHLSVFTGNVIIPNALVRMINDVRYIVGIKRSKIVTEDNPINLDADTLLNKYSQPSEDSKKVILPNRESSVSVNFEGNQNPNDDMKIVLRSNSCQSLWKMRRIIEDLVCD